MLDVHPLFPEDNSPSKGHKALLIMLVGGIGLAVMVIAFYGLGPLFIKPTAPTITSNTKDAAEVLGLNKPTSLDQLPTLDNSQLEIVIARLAQQVQLPAGDTAIGYVLQANFPTDPFLAEAQAGDVLVILQTSKQAILYRPADNTIIQTGTIGK